MPGVVVFGLSFGALVRERGVDPIAGAASSAIVGAGAGQTGAIEVFAAGGTLAVAVATALVINARFALYSAAVAPMFARFPRRWRWLLGYLLSDQVAALHDRAERWPDPRDQRRYVLGLTVPMRASWLAGTAAGVALGPIIPASWQIGVIVPLMFIALAVPSIRGAATLTAALVGAATVVALKDMPGGTNLLAAALIGATAGILVPEPRQAEVKT